MNKRNHVVIFLFLLVVFLYPSQAILVNGQAWQYEIPDGVQIINRTDRKIIFYLRCSGCRWIEYELPADTNNVYSKKNEIYIGTDGKWYVDYSLQEGNRYEIFLNTQKSIFDLHWLKE